MKKENENNPEKDRNKIDFIAIFKLAGLLIWQNRFLLWFGILMAFASLGRVNYSFSEDNLGQGKKEIENFFAAHWQISIILSLLFLFIVLALFLVSLIAKAGLANSVNAITLGKKSSFRSGWREGKKYLSRLFKLAVLFFCALIFLILILAVPVIYLLAVHSWVAAVFVGILAVAILIPLMFVLSFTKIFAELYIVLSDISLWSAVEVGYGLFLKNMLNSLIFGLLLFAVSVIAGIFMVPVIGIAFIVFAPAGILFYFLNKIVFGFYLALAVFLFTLTALFISSIFVTFSTTAQILFFKEIAQLKNEEENGVPEKTTEGIVVTPEKA